MKALNSGGTHDEFHRFHRRYMSGSLVIQDLDAIGVPLLFSDAASYEPTALVELKRSSKAVDEWRPYPEDRRNYTALLTLAEKAAIPLFVVYFVRGVEIEPETPLGVFWLRAVEPGYRGRRDVLSAGTFAKRFPRLFEADA